MRSQASACIGHNDKGAVTQSQIQIGYPGYATTLKTEGSAASGHPESNASAQDALPGEIQDG